MEDERLTIEEVSATYRIPVATLRYWRARGEGPRSFRLGRRVFYRRKDRDAWVDAAYARQSAGGVV
jgi:DNA-binding transcriptional MerR regulator